MMLGLGVTIPTLYENYDVIPVGDDGQTVLVPSGVLDANGMLTVGYDPATAGTPEVGGSRPYLPPCSSTPLPAGWVGPVNCDASLGGPVYTPAAQVPKSNALPYLAIGIAVVAALAIAAKS